MKRIAIYVICFLAGMSVSAQDVKVSVAKYRGGKACATSFTFDDGNKDNFTIAAPELEKRGWNGTFWLNCAKIPGEAGGTDRIMTWDDVVMLHQRGHEISNHGWNHRKLTKIPYDEAVIEVEKNDSAILAHTGVRPSTFCYPYNARNEQILELAGKERVGTRTRQYAFGEQSSDEQLRKRMDQVIAEEGWAVWMTHGITSGYDCFKDATRFTSFLDYVKDREDRIWVGTFREVSAYVAERDAVSVEVKTARRKMYVETSLDLDPELYDVPLTLMVEGVSKVTAKQDGRHLNVTCRDGISFLDFDPSGGKIVLRFL